MVVAVRKVGEDFVLPAQVADTLHLVDGSRIDVQPVADTKDFRYATVDEALRVFEETLPNHEEAYRELAK